MNTSTQTTNLRHDGRWIAGTVGNYVVQALAFAEGSEYGMDEDRRISKLWIARRHTHVTHTVVVDYDRNDRMVDRDSITSAELSEILEAVASLIPEAVA